MAGNTFEMMDRESLQRLVNELILAGDPFHHYLSYLLKEKDNATDIAADVQPLRTNVDCS